MTEFMMSTRRCASAPSIRAARPRLKRIAVALTAGLVASAAFAVTFVPLAGDLSVVTSSDRQKAVVTVANGGALAAQFCVSFAEPLDQPISIEAKGHVIYVPWPIESLPPGAQRGGAEPIAQTLTVVPANGPALALVAKGVKPIHDVEKVIVISSVSREDWAGPNNTRLAPDAAACLSADEQAGTHS